VQKEVISNTRRCYVVADASKFRPNAFVHTARFDQISGVITNREVDREIVVQLEDLGLEVVPV
jgi:DeoR/GlpR family transcriptional regulator of sugar metabolism